MDLPRPHKNEALNTYGRRIARLSVPTGGRKVKYAKNLIWRVTDRSSNTVVLDLKGPCKGPIGEVMDIGLKEVADLIEQSKLAQTPNGRAHLRQEAGRILRRLNELPREYEIQSLLRQLKAARRVQRESIWDSRIIEAKERELHILKQLLEHNAGKKNETIDRVVRGEIAA